MLQPPPPFSYILCKERLKNNSFELKETQLPCGEYFYSSFDLNFGLSINQYNGNYILLAGLTIDLKLNSIDNKVISEKLLENFNISKNSFFDNVDFIAGSYVIIYGNYIHKYKSIIGDAFGSIKIIFNKDLKVASSNIFLINKIFQGGHRIYSKYFLSDYRAFWKFGSIGTLQPLHGYEILTPNINLNLVTFEISRFYPREQLYKIDNDDYVIRELLNLIFIQNNLLRKKYNLFYSLTAGIDSRFSLALSDLRDEDVFFTYAFNENEMKDVKTAVQISKSLNLEHAVILGRHFKNLSNKVKNQILSNHSKLIDCQDLDKNFIDEINSWDWYQHGSSKVFYIKNFLLPNYQKNNLEPLHIRSNLYETARVFWNKKDYNEIKDTSEILKYSRKDWLENFSHIFTSYFSSSEYEKAQLFGYDLLDLFYWEHRCGTWVSEVLQGTNFAFNTHHYMNCRKIVELLLKVPYKKRLKNTIFNSIISQNLKKIENIKFNPN